MESAYGLSRVLPLVPERQFHIQQLHSPVADINVD